MPKNWESLETWIDETFMIICADQETYDLNYKYLDNANETKIKRRYC